MDDVRPVAFSRLGRAVKGHSPGVLGSAPGVGGTRLNPGRVLVTLQAYIPAEKLLESHVGFDAQCCHLSHQRGPDPASVIGAHTSHPVVEGACEVVQRDELKPLLGPLFIKLDEHLVTADANDAVYLDAST